MSETRGQRTLKWKLNFLTSGIRIKSKKIRQDETEIQNINLGGTCTLRLSPLGRKRLALAGRDMCGKFPHSAAPYHRFGYRSVHSDLCPRYGCTLCPYFMYKE